MLLAILHFVGPAESAVAHMSNYIMDRFQRTKFKNISVDFLHVQSRVSQGSILGKLLYSIYTCNLTGNLCHCKCYFYADDTQVYHAFEKDEKNFANNIINDDFYSLYRMSSKHSLTLNPSNSIAAIFVEAGVYTENLNISIEISNVPSQISNICTNLSVYIDCNL